ncbi:MAG: hypothetical protein KY447_09405 [Actinobacteria bacterium]|nr:hypothetical protein [Actinomycetota bacterium]
MTLDGSNALLRALAAELREEIREEERNLLRAARKMQARARQLVPVDDGELRDAIDLTEGRLGRKGYYVEVGVRSSTTGVDHALPVEYGKRDRPPKPFMRGAYQEAARDLS